MTDWIVKLDRLEKHFDAHPVLRGITATVAKGDVVGLLGLNGAGKTTLLETILGFAIPEAGTAALFGQQASAIADERLKHRIGFVPQQDELIETMKGHEFLGLISQFYETWNQDLIDRLARDWDVPLYRPALKLSLGQRQKLSILAALGHEPELIVLDEPVASLDPLARRAFLRELIGIVSAGDRTVLFSTHIVSDLERIASRVWIIRDGELVVDESLDALKESSLVKAAVGGSPAGAVPGRTLEEIFLELHR
jgi:ABC-2 type transport system ATP-binding protein